MKKVLAFTLAEVLIALAIVGIVAAVVIPTLMVNMQARKYKVALDKGLSTLAKAATANFGLEGYDFSGTNGYYGEINNPIATYSTGGTDDGYDIIGFNTLPRNDINPYSDLYSYTDMLKHHLQMEIDFRGMDIGVKFMRKFFPYYISGVKNAAKIRALIVLEDDPQKIFETLDILQNAEPERV